MPRMAAYAKDASHRTKEVVAKWVAVQPKQWRCDVQPFTDVLGQTLQPFCTRRDPVCRVLHNGHSAACLWACSARGAVEAGQHKLG